MSLCNPYNTDCTLKASKNPLVTKAVFNITNIDDSYNVDDVKDYVATLNVRLINCFELPSKRKQPSENKNFRVCIYASDKNNLLVKKNWSSGILIQDWMFHPKKSWRHRVCVSASLQCSTIFAYTVIGVYDHRNVR